MKPWWRYLKHFVASFGDFVLPFDILWRSRQLNFSWICCAVSRSSSAEIKTCWWFQSFCSCLPMVFFPYLQPSTRRRNHEPNKRPIGGPSIRPINGTKAKVRSSKDSDKVQKYLRRVWGEEVTVLGVGCWDMAFFFGWDKWWRNDKLKV